MLSWLKKTSPTKGLLTRLYLISFLVGLITFLLIHLLRLGSIVETLEIKALDLRMMLPVPTPQHQPSKDIVIIKFDDATIELFEEDYGRWPWPRGVHAKMIDLFTQVGAKAIVYDIMFSSKTNAEDDAALVKSFVDNPNVFFSMNLNNFGSLRRELHKQMNQNPQAIEKMALNLQSSMIPGLEYANVDTKGFFENPSLKYDYYRSLLPELMAFPERIGVINHIRDSDGVSRSNPLIFQLSMDNPKTGKKDVYYLPYLGLRVCLALKNLDKAPLKLSQNATLRVANHHIPLTPDGFYMVNWYQTNVDWLIADKAITGLGQVLAQNNTEEQQKHYQLLYNHYIQQKNKATAPKPYREIPAWEVVRVIQNQAAGQLSLKDKLLKQSLKNKIIFVGTTAVSTYDIKTTPVNKVLPGVVLQAVLFDNLYQNSQHIHRVNSVNNTLLTGLLCIFACYAMIKLRSAWQGFLMAVALGAVYLLVNVYLFKFHGLWLNLAAPLLSLLALTTVTFMVKYTSRSKDLEATYKLATTDELTQLYNHRYFQDQLRHALERHQRTQQSFSLILIDIDHFKQFNDQFGHLIGDLVLKLVAQTLKQNVRTNDIVARYGGEEMVILLDNADEAQAMDIANKLVQVIGSRTYTLGKDQEHHVTISAGVATCPTHGDQPEALIELADNSLYTAKKAGRNQVGPLPPSTTTVPGDSVLGGR